MMGRGRFMRQNLIARLLLRIEYMIIIIRYLHLGGLLCTEKPFSRSMLALMVLTIMTIKSDGGKDPDFLITS